MVLYLWCIPVVESKYSIWDSLNLFQLLLAWSPYLDSGFSGQCNKWQNQYFDMSGQIEKSSGNARWGFLEIGVHIFLSVGYNSRPQSRLSAFSQTDCHCLRLSLVAALILQGDTLTFWVSAVCFFLTRYCEGKKGAVHLLLNCESLMALLE